MNNRKYILFIVDGAADRPIPALHGKTALETADHPTMDRLATDGRLGLSTTIPMGFPAGTDAALLTLFGYTGGPAWSRGALEAAGLGVDTSGYANMLRCNLVSLSDDGVLLSRNGHDIDEETAAVLLHALLEDDELHRCLRALGARVYPGRGFRHLIATQDCWPGYWPPHDHLGEPTPFAPPAWAEFLGRAASLLRQRSAALGPEHPVNGLWPWGGGPAPEVPPFADLFGLEGDCVAAASVVQGIAHLAGLDSIEVSGATGTLYTDWRAKVHAVLASPRPFTLLHLEAPDECSHEKDSAGKVRAVEMADAMLASLLEGLDARQTPYRVLLMADHGTSALTGEHLADPVPYLLFDSILHHSSKARRFSEADAAMAGQPVDGSALLSLLLRA